MALKRITNFGKNSIVASDWVSHARATDVGFL
jgi:hypothetical protein